MVMVKAEIHLSETKVRKAIISVNVFMSCKTGAWDLESVGWSYYLEQALVLVFNFDLSDDRNDVDMTEIGQRSQSEILHYDPTLLC